MSGERRLARELGAPTRRRRTMAIVRIGALVLMAVAVVLAFRYTPIGELLAEERMAALRGRLGAWAGPLWSLFYGFTVGLWVPGTPLTALGAAIFGPFEAIVFNYFGAVFGAIVGFVVGRVVGRDAIRQLFASRFPLYDRYEALLRDHGFESVLYLRLVPTPYTLISYVAGLSPIPLWKYVAGTALGIIPGSIVFTWLLGRMVDAGRTGDWWLLLDWWTVLALVAYALTAAIPLGVRFTQRRFGWFGFPRVGKTPL